MWVDCMVLPFGNVMVIGLYAVRLLVAGAFSTKKWPVAPELEIACATDLVMRCLLTLVAALGIWSMLFAWMIVFHAVVRLGILTFDGWL